MKTLRTAILFLVTTVMLLPSLLDAAPTVPGFYGSASRSLPSVMAGQLPVLKPGGLVNGALTPVTSGNRMTIYQTQPKAYLDWKSFDIGASASVYFNQQGNTSWAALNRIWDANPSQIFGRLSADGRVFLINQNGIIFGPSSQINVHSLVASSLNLTVDNFLSNTLTFNTQPGTINGQQDAFYDQSNLPGTASNTGLVSNRGTIQTDTLGSVFLIGPQVENTREQIDLTHFSPATIIAPNGQIGLIAGTDIDLVSPLASSSVLFSYPGNETRTTLMVKVNNGGGGYRATNAVGGILQADTGLVGMYGNIVNQSGIITSVAAVQKGGHVELFASDLISTGPGSVISTPVSSSADVYDPSFQTAQSSITLSGIDPSYPATPKVATTRIEHNGMIISPSGIVTMNAVDRVYLASGSLVDVSGLWVDRLATEGLIRVQLNTANLRDYYVQKGGVLKGQYIQISTIGGSAIGDVSGAVTTQGKTAWERHNAGGTVYVNSTGDIVVREGAVINFSGGGAHYAAGALDTTKLVSGYKVYDIASAGADIVYDSILNSQAFTNPRFGITKRYEGIYYGGAVPVRQYVQAYTVGGNAGSLYLQAPTVVLDGTIYGKATNGAQQVLVQGTTDDATWAAVWEGYKEAQGGALKIGNTDVTAESTAGDGVDFVTQAIDIVPAAAPLPTTFQATDPLPSTKTTLPATTLTNAGLGTLRLAANTAVTIKAGAQLSLDAGGEFKVRARRIENYGGVRVPGGSITLQLETNMTSNPTHLYLDESDGELKPEINGSYVPLNELIYLADGSSLTAAGERIDNTGAAATGTSIVIAHRLKGGSVSVLDKTVTGQGVFMSPGAVVDVGGGWRIDPSGKVTGGDAGSVAFQAPSLIINGDLRGQSLVGSKGGSISLTAPNITVAPLAGALPAGFSLSDDYTLPEYLKGQLVLGSDQLDRSGFTTVSLNSVNDISIQAGTLGPSLAKLANPVSSSSAGRTVIGVRSSTPVGSGVFLAGADQIEGSKISLLAGASGSVTSGVGNPYGNGLLLPSALNQFATISVGSGAAITTTPSGSISMTAPFVDIAGLLNSPAGTINLAASKGGAGGSEANLTLEPSARILAEGYNQPASTALLKGLPVQANPVQGGTVTLKADTKLILSPGALVSVSGSLPTRQASVGSDRTLSFVTVGSEPGTINLTAGAIEGLSARPGRQAAVLSALAFTPGLRGGTLSIQADGSLSLQMADLLRFKDEGFDSLSLAAQGADLSIGGSGSVRFGRELTLSASRIVGSGSALNVLDLGAPWVKLTSGGTSSESVAITGGQSQIALSGTWLDVTGNMGFSGFRAVSLSADRDMTFSDNGASVAGLLAVSGDLTLRAARIYPTTLSSFTIDTTGAPAPYGRVTILRSGTSVDSPIFSAAGSLTIKAAGGSSNGVGYGGIDQEGYLAAPMGSLTLTSDDGRVYLGKGSVTTTRGSDAAVSYGVIQLANDSLTLGDNVWAVLDKTSTTPSYLEVTDAPAKSISLTSRNGEIIVQDGASIDISGGGTVYAARFLPSYSGTSNPLTGSFVILPDNSIVLPGSSAYLSGVKGLAAGTYSLLPALDGNGNPTPYVFLPGALIVTDLGVAAATNRATVTSDGFPIASGYSSFAGTAIRSSQPRSYELRPASTVLSQGYFETLSATAGAAGAVAIAGHTTVLSGTILASAMAGYPGGSVALSGDNVKVQASTNRVLTNFDFSTPVPQTLSGTLNIAASALSNKGFRTIGLGVSDVSGSDESVAASTVEIEPGVALQAESIILGARNSVTLDAGARILALASSGGTGWVSFVSGVDGSGKPTATVNLGANAVVHASDGITLQTLNTNLDPTATFMADHSTLNLRNNTITFVNDPSEASGGGLFLTVDQWSKLSSQFGNIILTSLSDLVFSGTFDLSAKDSLTIDAARIVDSAADAAQSVTLSAKTISLRNTAGGGTASGLALDDSITFNASQIRFLQDSPLFDGFSGVNLNALSNVTFYGKGTLKTGGGDLTVTAPRVGTSYYMRPGDPTGNKTVLPVYTAASYTVDAGTGRIVMNGNGSSSSSVAAPGGTLSVAAREIDISTIVEVPAGRINLTAADNITLGAGGRLLAVGTDSAPGGVVTLMSTNGGAVTLSSGSLIDVSAGSQGDAGSISLYAPTGGVSLSDDTRNIMGLADGGTGGSFSIVTNTLDAPARGPDLFSRLNSQLLKGGFDGSLDIEATTGNISIASGQTVRAGKVTITADGGVPDGGDAGVVYGNLTVDGEIQADGSDASVELNAWNNLTVNGTIAARKTNRDGGILRLNAGHVASWDNSTPKKGTGAGSLTVNAQSTLDVSGAPADPGAGLASGAGGTVYFRAYASGTDSRMSLLGGTVKGASEVFAETVQAYRVDGNAGSYSSYIPTDGSGNYINPIAVSSSLKDANGDSLQVKKLFGLEIQSTGNLIFNTPWDLSLVRPGGRPGVLTLRAAGGLSINANITDSPLVSGAPDLNRNYRFLLSGTAMPSWSYNLVAGANLGSSNLLGTTPQNVQGATGYDLSIGTSSSGKVLFTQKGSIRFASSGDTVIYQSPLVSYMTQTNMTYSLGTYTGDIRGAVGGSLVIFPNAAIQSATGNIDIEIGKQLDLTGISRGATTQGTASGAIRTTGERPAATANGYKTDANGNPLYNSSGELLVSAAYGFSDYYSFAGGGSIDLDVGDSVVGRLNAGSWLSAPSSSSTYTREGRQYLPVTANYGQTTSTTQGIAAMAGGSVTVRVGGDFEDTQIGTFGEGDLRLFSGGDVSGRFLVQEGTGVVSAMGSFGVPEQSIKGEVKPVPQLVEMGASRVSILARGNIEIGAIVNPGLAEHNSASSLWDNGYTEASSITLEAATGDVNLYNYTSDLVNAVFSNSYIKNAPVAFDSTTAAYLPATVEIHAGRDIVVSNNYYQLPAEDGNLTMDAGRDIIFRGGAMWTMSDADPGSVYPGYPAKYRPTDLGRSHASSPVHEGDTNPVVISAGRNITDASLIVAKMATVTAGGTISNLTYTGQNIQPFDVTSIVASRDITYSKGTGVRNDQIAVGGPGYLLVQAGGTIDLGASDGIQTTGNAANPALLSGGREGASLIVAAGANAILTPEGVTAFFDALRAAGIEYSNLKASGDLAGADGILARARAATIDRFLSSTSPEGDISMTSSQISTVGGGSLYIIATGALNVGTTLLATQTQNSSNSKTTGVLTETGGAINVFTVGDVNVNEARMMTFQGGDITVWSDRGNINAGKGDKTAISASKPTFTCVDNVCSVKFNPPAVGSGIRALTYASDENTPPPPAGDIYLFAPSGIIDAGEAGISGGRIFLAATAVLNATNISFSAGSVGVPAASQGVSLGALTGSGDLSSKSAISSDTGALAQAQERVASGQPVEDMIVKWIDVKVIGYDLTFGPEDREESKDKGKKETH